jgi:hypothetical protein
VKPVTTSSNGTSVCLSSIPVNGDADKVIVLKSGEPSPIATTLVTISVDVDGAIETPAVRHAIAHIMEGGKEAFDIRIDALWRLHGAGPCFPGRRIKCQEYILCRRVAGGLTRSTPGRRPSFRPTSSSTPTPPSGVSIGLSQSWWNCRLCSSGPAAS